MEADNEIEYSTTNIYQVWLGIQTCGMEEEKAGLIRERSQTDAGPQNLSSHMGSSGGHMHKCVLCCAVLSRLVVYNSL